MVQKNIFNNKFQTPQFNKPTEKFPALIQNLPDTKTNRQVKNKYSLHYSTSKVDSLIATQKYTRFKNGQYEQFENTPILSS